MLREYEVLISCGRSNLILFMFPSEDYWSAPRHSDLQRNQTLTSIALIPPLTHVWLPMEVSVDTKITGPVKVITECNQNALLWNRVMSLTGLTYLQHFKRYIPAVYVGFQASIIPATISDHVMNTHGIRPDASKVRSVAEFSPPRSLKQVQTILGLCSYFGRVTPQYASKEQPLQELLKKRTLFVWGQE